MHVGAGIRLTGATTPSCSTRARRILTGLAASVMAVASTNASAQTAGPTPHCGDTIRRDTTLRADLLNCQTVGLVIGADDITLDLNGHTISSLPPSSGSSAEFGISITGRRGVRVLGPGTVRGFSHSGVSLEQATAVTVAHLSVTGNQFGVLVRGGSRDTVWDVKARRNLHTGIAVDGRSHVIGFSTGSSNGDGGGPGAGLGISGEDITLVGNTTFGNFLAGMELSGLEYSFVAGNSAGKSERGVTLLGSHNRIVNNHIAGDCGPKCNGADYGIVLVGGTENDIMANLVENRRHGGIVVTRAYRDAPKAVDNVVRWNTLRHVGGDGITVVRASRTDVSHNSVRDSGRDGIEVRKSSGTALSLNRVSNSGRDGIRARDARTLIRGNHADRNVRLGINAVKGTSDGGSNRATGNGDPKQCLNVRCG